ncbi:hypothetical protein BDZ91DRAFT_768683 [Kalaharituber pfeilii]|nr:hypothetical protein BDZ91DRAFT_768683 [Kalaharituber pfeilii]
MAPQFPSAMVKVQDLGTGWPPGTEAMSQWRRRQSRSELYDIERIQVVAWRSKREEGGGPLYRKLSVENPGSPRLSGGFCGFPASSGDPGSSSSFWQLFAMAGHAGIYIGVLAGVRRIARVSGSAARVRVLASRMLVASIRPELDGLGRGVRVGLLQ